MNIDDIISFLDQEGVLNFSNEAFQEEPQADEANKYSAIDWSRIFQKKEYSEEMT